MSVKVTIEGMDKVMENLNKEISKIKGASLKGMIHSAITIRRDMEAASPKIPVDTGNLRASWFTVTSDGKTEEGQGAQFKGEDSGKLSKQHTSVVEGEKGQIKSSEPKLSMGFTANYAAPVHENMEAKFQRSGAGPKFFESALRRNARVILQTIQKYAKIK